MPSSIPHKLCPRGWPAAAFAVVAVVLLAPTVARAGCGVHVLVRPAADAPSSEAVVPTQPTKKHFPCSGPHCTRSPIAPAPTPSAPVAPPLREWACVLIRPLPPDVTIAMLAPPVQPAHPLALASSIFHPPR